MSVRQARVEDRGLGRVTATIRTGVPLMELAGAIAAGLVAAAVGLRAAVFIAPTAALLATWFLWRSPARRLRAASAPTPPVSEAAAQGRDGQ